MADTKQLVLVVEGNAALGHYWHTIVSDYLLKCIRSLCGNEASEAASPNVELALVQFSARGSYSCLVQRSGWTRNVDYFLEWLSAMQFSGCGFGDAAIAEGLAEALMMFPCTNANQTQQDGDFRRHCILVSASNPYPLPTPVYRPSDKNGRKLESCLSDAETLAKSYPQCSVSLSVISPRQLPKLKAIYKAGKRNPSTADPTISDNKNPQYIVLISENFMEAYAALSPSGMTSSPSNQSPSNMEVTSVSEPPTTTSCQPVNESMLSQHSAPVGTVSPVTVKSEPSTASSVASPYALQHVPSKGDSSLQTCSPLSTSQELISSNDNMQDLKPAVSGMQQPIRPANVSILNNLSQTRLTNADGTSIGGNPMVMHMSNMISGGMASSSSSSVPVVQTVQSSITTMAGSAPLARATQDTNVGDSQRTSSAQQSGRSKYVKAWEGGLFGRRQGQSVFITRLEGWRSLTNSSDSLVEDWPSTLVIDRLVSQDVVNIKQHAGKVDYIVFRAMNDHRFLGQLQEKNLSTVVRLPSQTLLLSVSDKRSRLIGMVFPVDMVELKPHIPRQQPSQQQQQLRVGTGTSQGTGGGRTKLVGQGHGSSPGPKA